MLWPYIAVLAVLTITASSLPTHIKTYQSNAQYLVANSGQIVRCVRNENQATKFGITSGLNSKSGHASLNSFGSLMYVAGNYNDQFLRLESFQNNQRFNYLASFIKRTNHFYQGTVSYESSQFKDYFLMCASGRLQFKKVDTNNQATRASFVLKKVTSTNDPWGPCSRTCGGGTQKGKRNCPFFGICSDVPTRRCNEHACPADQPCIPNPCKNGGTCSAGWSGGISCDCPRGYNGNRCQHVIHPCDLQNPCKNGGSCQKIGLNYKCNCRNGYTGQHCETKRHPCESFPCLNGGTCVRFTKDYICNCGPKYTGRNCDTLIRERCTSTYCDNGGKCVETNSGLKCNCNFGYKGDRCQTAINPCAKNPCKNGGTCTRSGATDFYCKCPPRFSGPFCETAVKLPCDSSPCLNGGTCVAFPKTFVCNCAPKFTGKTCEIAIGPRCTSSYCQNGGTCQETSAGLKCICPTGFDGNKCENVIRQTCTSSYCRNSGTCRETSTGLKCKCRPGYEGDRCQITIQGFQWSSCSKTCGPGTRYRKCQPNDSRRCDRRYEDCQVKPCPPVTCTTYRFNSETECCNKKSSPCGVPDPNPSARRVFGGVKSEERQWPWQVSIWRKQPEVFFCGGALVSDKWVVTAGHCAGGSGVTRQQMEVRGGMNVLSGNNPGLQKSDVEQIIMHPNFNNPVNDIGLLKLATAMKFTSYVKPICFPHGEVVDEDVICFAAGWGAASDADVTARRPSNDLLHVGLRTLPHDACLQGFKNIPTFLRGVTDRALCAGVLGGGKDTCIGDSGGPFVCQRKNSCEWYLAGIGSFGPTQCGIGWIPAVFMDIQKYETWIKQQISQN